MKKVKSYEIVLTECSHYILFFAVKNDIFEINYHFVLQNPLFADNEALCTKKPAR